MRTCHLTIRPMLFKKGTIILFLTLFGCSNTKYIAYSSWPTFPSDASILVLQVFGIDETTSFDLYESALTDLKIEKNNVLYLPQYEYDLINAGIDRDQLQNLGSEDSLNHLVARELNVAYLLDVKIVELTSTGGSFGTYTEIELNKYNSHYNQENEKRNASLLFNFLDLKQNTSRKFLVSTSINPVDIRNKNGGETRINISSQETALKLAYRKGIKKIKKGMIEK